MALQAAHMRTRTNTPTTVSPTILSLCELLTHAVSVVSLPHTDLAAGGGSHSLAVAWSASLQPVGDNTTNNRAPPPSPGAARPLIYYDLEQVGGWLVGWVFGWVVSWVVVVGWVIEWLQRHALPFPQPPYLRPDHVSLLPDQLTHTRTTHTHSHSCTHTHTHTHTHICTHAHARPTQPQRLSDAVHVGVVVEGAAMDLYLAPRSGRWVPGRCGAGPRVGEGGGCPVGAGRDHGSVGGADNQAVGGGLRAAAAAGWAVWGLVGTGGVVG